MAGTGEVPPHAAAVSAAPVAVQATALACLAAAPWMVRGLGPTGTGIAGRLMGFLLAASAFQHLVGGFAALRMRATLP